MAGSTEVQKKEKEIAVLPQIEKWGSGKKIHSSNLYGAIIKIGCNVPFISFKLYKWGFTNTEQFFNVPKGIYSSYGIKIVKRVFHGT